jgi:hypothetical protein
MVCPKFASKLRAVAIRAPLRFQRIAVGLLFVMSPAIQITLAWRGICSCGEFEVTRVRHRNFKFKSRAYPPGTFMNKRSL